MSTRNREQEHGVPANKDLFLGHNMGVECFNGRNINTWTATGTVKMNTDKLCNVIYETEVDSFPMRH